MPKPGGTVELCAKMSADLARLKRSRTAAKGWLSRAASKLQEALENKEIDICLLRNLISEFDRRLVSWDESQNQVELAIEDEALQADQEEAIEFREGVMKTRYKADKVSGDNECASVASQSHQLPRLNLPKFGGDSSKWTGFWESFEVSVHKTDLPSITKLTYLRSLLFGEAELCVAGLRLSSDSYDATVQILKDRYGRRERIVFSHVQALLSLGSAQFDSLQKLKDKLLVHIRSLEALEVGGDMYGIFLTPLILSKLPEDVRMEWARQSSGKEGDLPFLMDFLSDEIRRQELSGAYGGLSEATASSDPDSSSARSARGPSTSGGHRQAATRRSQPEQRRSGPASRGASAAALQAASRQASRQVVSKDTSQQVCGFCKKDHPSEQCPVIDRLPIRERMRRVRFSGLCFRCLKPDHQAKDCELTCQICSGRHHRICCYSGPAGQNFGVERGVSLGSGPKESDVVGGVKVSLSCTAGRDTCVVLPTAKVLVHGTDGVVEATALFDSGSDRTYVTESLVKRVGAEWVGSQKVNFAAFGGGKVSEGDRNVYKMCVKGAAVPDRDMNTFSAVAVPVICAPLSRPSVPDVCLTEFKDLTLADGDFTDRVLSIDLLIGLDCYWHLIRPGVLTNSSGLTAQDSCFGWVLSGAAGEVSCSPNLVSCRLLCLGDLQDREVRNLWELEGVGVSSKELSDDEDAVLEHFASSVKFCDGRYEVELPWKGDARETDLQSNRHSAERRLQGLSRQLDRDKLRSEYDLVLQGMEASGVIEEVPESELTSSSGPQFYMPHRPVVRPDSATTRVRPVFDASACGPNGVSLNDCLEAGPSLIPRLTDVLLRFRRHKYAVTGDISKAFLQISVRPEDRDCLRFLWEQCGKVRVMRLTRVPFGVKSSPFLLNAVIKHHLSQCSVSRVVSELQDNLYVDDWLSGADSEAEAKEMYLEGKAVLMEAGMTLTKCHSNSELVLDSAGGSQTEERLKILGVRWDPAQDAMRYEGVCLPPGVVGTKRVVLSFLARMFDPLGLLVPFVLTGKVLFQKLWTLGLGWDDCLPPDEERVFQRWLSGIPLLQQLTLERCYVTGDVCWSEVSDQLELHVFGDASVKGYGCVVYLRYPLPDGGFAASFVMARARVAPVKTVTLPRLELLGCLMAARMVKHVRCALQLPDVQVYCWTDSTVALAWIKSHPCKWKQFVRNRVEEVQSITDPSVWNHTPGPQNPADAASRGLFADQLVESELWLQGPEWLRSPGAPPAVCGLFVTSEELSEPDIGEPEPEAGEALSHGELSPVRPSDATAPPPAATPVTLVSQLESESQGGVFPVERWGSLSKAARVVAWVLRFVRNSRDRSHRCSLPDLTGEEVAAARDVLFRQAQRASFPDEIKALEQGRDVAVGSPIRSLTPYLADGVLRVRGRLQFSDLCYEEKHPFIVPKGHLAVLLVREQHDLLKHAGVATLITAVRSSMWVVGLRGIARRVVRGCLACRRQDSRACCEPAAPLPSDRVSPTPPFSVVGIDFAGPLFAVDFPKKKFYVLLFTCAVTRAVHLELTGSLTLDEFMLAFRRFSARRGVPSTVYSDNACTFKGADLLLQRYFGRLAPVWKFITPQSPWHGGWWERLVRSVKLALRKSLAQRCLSRVELETVLIEIEACVNSRPITFVGDTVDSPAPLTPNHFLTGHSIGFQAREAEDPSAVTAKALGGRARIREQRLNRFWSVWSDEYLRNLPPAVSKFRSRGKLCEGSVVLIQNENLPRLKWELAVVTRLFPGRDGVVRSAEVRTAGGKKTRPVQRLHDLEVTAAV